MQIAEILTNPIGLLPIFSLLRDHHETIKLSPARERGPEGVNYLHSKCNIVRHGSVYTD